MNETMAQISDLAFEAALAGYVVALVLTTIAVIYIGLFPQAFFDWAVQAAAVLLPQ